MKVNSVYKVNIIDNDNLGNGIAKIDNFVIFVYGALKDETLEIKIDKIKKNFAYASIINIENKSDNRIEVKCPYYNECGGCNYLHTTYENERSIKKKYLERLFKCDVDYLESNNIYNYRNKVVFHVKDGKIGFYSKNTNNLCEIGDCLLLDKNISAFYSKLKEINLKGVNEIMIRSVSNKIMVNILQDEAYNIDNVVNLEPNSLYVNGKYVMREEYLIDEINNLKFSIYPESFYQVNKEGMKLIYDEAKKYALRGNNLLDLYCGTGTIGIWLSDNFNNVIGYEINASSIKNAKLNLKLNNISNIDFVLSDSKDVKGTYDTIVVDPPRVGLSKEVINYLNSSNAIKIIYISCNPNTLKRDIDLLSNYELKNISACDMFPRTKHIECVSLLCLKEPSKN